MVTADEIRSRTFLVSLRGFDRDQVKEFLTEVAAALEAAQARVQELETEIARRAEAAQTTVEAPAAPDEGAPAGGEASPFAEVGAETQRILEAAQAAAEQMRKRAQADAERELKSARAQAARIIAEGERLREGSERAVEALATARGELAEELRDVGRTIERVLRELAPAQGAATVREALAETARDEAAAREEAPGSVETPPDAGEGAPATDDDEGARTTTGEEQAPPATAVVSGEGGEEPLAGEGQPLAGEGQPVRAGGGGEPASAGGEPNGEGDPEPVAVAATVDASHQAASRSNASAPGGGTALDATATPEPGGAAANGDRGEAPDGPGPRARSLAPLHSKLVRKLKRGLQDVQNATLDALRRDPNRTDVEPFLPDETAVRALSALAEDQLTRAHAAGIAAAAEATGARVALEPSGRALAEQLGSELGGVLVTRLADGLRAGFDAGQGMTALTERVDLVFTRIKSGPAGDVASVALVRAYEGGRRDAWAASGITHRRWVRASEPPCTDPRCVDNESAGAVPVGERFPSRHDAPPVRPGCQCSTAPAGS